MGWKEIRAKSRDIVHKTFAHPAIYVSPAGEETPCMVRLHNRMELFGDLDREGFAKVYEEVNQALFDSAEVIPNKNGGWVDFGVDVLFQRIPDINHKYTIVNIDPEKGNRYIKTEITRRK